MLFHFLRHSEAKKSGQTMMAGMKNYDQWIQVLSGTAANLYFWIDLAILTVVHDYMK